MILTTQQIKEQKIIERQRLCIFYVQNIFIRRFLIFLFVGNYILFKNRLTHILTHLLTHLLTHSLTHLLTHQLSDKNIQYFQNDIASQDVISLYKIKSVFIDMKIKFLSSNIQDTKIFLVNMNSTLYVNYKAQLWFGSHILNISE